ncbi:hypothetical protein G7072_12080 [Nocardioides sp. HDW12B]|uniref:hypothetical protein n=1 Tax=Nocardioides sp. HDW12B TaxID=2714939 RepID=UPI001408E75C|nr:hypothetical protein [Nocardioides sp. HDW12B]QIK66981.1 hypothetical protein G7072_12080 [Nocardioides sp. HDW12B]
MRGSRRTALVVGAGVLMLVAAAVTGVVLLREIQERGGTTWDDYQADSRGLLVHVRARPCDDLDVLDVRERPQRVEVTVAVESGGLFCSEPAEDRRIRVGLEERLGKRDVYDGTCLADGEPTRECARDERPAGERDRERR